MGQSTSATVSIEELSPDSPTIFQFFARAWIGGLALAWDELGGLARSPSIILERGEALERSLIGRWRRFGDDTRSGSQRFSTALRSPFDWAVDSVQFGSTKAEVELERQIELALDRLGIPSRERLAQLGAEIDALAERIDEELARQVV